MTTPCDCTKPGYCPRHHCQKTPHWHQLCQTQSAYFQLWEEGRGPGQVSGQPTPAPPGLLQKVWNVTQAVAAFVADGCQTVDQIEYARRLAICNTCDQRRENVCLACGCFLPIKARARAMECPLGKWEPVGPASSAPASPKHPTNESLNSQADSPPRTGSANPVPPQQVRANPSISRGRGQSRFFSTPLTG